jgi:hypothetical protein
MAGQCCVGAGHKDSQRNVQERVVIGGQRQKHKAFSVPEGIRSNSGKWQGDSTKIPAESSTEGNRWW